MNPIPDLVRKIVHKNIIQNLIKFYPITHIEYEQAFSEVYEHAGRTWKKEANANATGNLIYTYTTLTLLEDKHNNAQIFINENVFNACLPTPILAISL